MPLLPNGQLGRTLKTNGVRIGRRMDLPFSTAPRGARWASEPLQGTRNGTCRLDADGDVRIDPVNDMPTPETERTIRSIEWKRAGTDSYANVTDAIEHGVVSATPNPNDHVDRPKGYSVTLTLKPDSTALADELQEALLDVEPARLTVQLEGSEAPIEDLPVSVSKVPHPGDQNVAELGVPPEGHDLLHEHFGG